MAFQLEIAFVGDIVDFESMTTGFACELFAIVGAEIGREYEGVRMIETQQVGERTVHFVRDEEVVDAEGLFRECIGKWMVDNGDARAAIEQNAGVKAESAVRRVRVSQPSIWRSGARGRKMGGRSRVSQWWRAVLRSAVWARRVSVQST